MSSNNNKQPLDLTYSSPVFDKTLGFLLDCVERGENRHNQPSPSICKVSRILRDLSVRSFIPQLVSIGPIHRENKKLKEFEWQKECYLNSLLSRCEDSTPKEILKTCLLEVNTLIPKIRESYAGVKNYSDVDLAMMMVIDGYFILEFCFKHEHEHSDLANNMQTLRIAIDLMLLENQVPFFVLQALFDCLAPYISKNNVTLSQVLDTHLAPYINPFREKNSTKKNSILSNVLNKLCSLLPEKNSTTDVDSDSTPAHVDSDSTPAHVLGYLHKRYQLVAGKSSKAKHAEASKPVDEEQAAKSSNHIKDAAFHSIVELDRSGMNFKPHQEDDQWSMTIKFQPSLFTWSWSKPTLLMPTLVIEDTTERILRNFIAYEQSFPHVRRYFTSYAYAMDMLIDTQEDIAKLVESKVLVNMLGSNQEAADMINKICKNISITDFYYKAEFKQMDTYYNGVWPKNIAFLRRVYFSNPWSTIALLGAMILFGLTVVSTIFTVLQYFG